ncbi:MAG: hypothetical protein LBF72_00775 [Holosporales bacterium]|nr:hypothetical protein [Holosporales bacterium]
MAGVSKRKAVLDVLLKPSIDATNQQTFGGLVYICENLRLLIPLNSDKN